MLYCCYDEDSVVLKIWKADVTTALEPSDVESSGTESFRSNTLLKATAIDTQF